jgi:hypothetical protein
VFFAVAEDDQSLVSESYLLLAPLELGTSIQMQNGEPEQAEPGG